MGPLSGAQDAWVELSVAARPCPGFAVSGDLHAIAECSRGMLLAVIDGLGHGPPAAEAARRARDLLVQAPGDPLELLVARCHEQLRFLRGAVLSAAFVSRSEPSLAWLGVGNVEAILLRASPGSRPAQRSMPLTPGLVGGSLPSLEARVLDLEPGDTLVLATDGVRSTFPESLAPAAPPAVLARRILDGYARGTDDALVLVARYLGGSDDLRLRRGRSGLCPVAARLRARPA